MMGACLSIQSRSWQTGVEQGKIIMSGITDTSVRVTWPRKRSLGFLLGFLAAARFCAPASAEGLDWLSLRAFDIQVSSSLGTGSLVVDASSGVWDDRNWVWSIVGPLAIETDTGEVLAILDHASISLAIAAPPTDVPGAPTPHGPGVNSVGLAFAVTNAGAEDLSFTATSGLVSFLSMTNPFARASAGLLLTDNNGNSAHIYGGHAGKSYVAHYNDLAPGGTEFAALLSDVVAEPFGIVAVDEVFPAVDFAMIPGMVHDISSQFAFTLSGFDSVAMSSIFVVVPEPASLGLFGLAAVAILGRRRRRR